MRGGYRKRIIPKDSIVANRENGGLIANLTEQFTVSRTAISQRERRLGYPPRRRGVPETAEAVRVRELLELGEPTADVIKGTSLHRSRVYAIAKRLIKEGFRVAYTQPHANKEKS